jgi:hypothetical protein
LLMLLKRFGWRICAGCATLRNLFSYLFTAQGRINRCC